MTTYPDDPLLAHIDGSGHRGGGLPVQPDLVPVQDTRGVVGLHYDTVAWVIIIVV